MRKTALGAVCIALAGCAFTPGGGPMASRISGGAAVELGERDAQEAYAYFNMSQSMARRVNGVSRGDGEPRDSKALFRQGASAQSYIIGADDLLDISIISVDTAGFVDFSQSAVSPLSRTDLPRQRVGADGLVQAPPLGRVRAKGLTPQELERRLSDRLAGVLVDPKAVVQVAEARSRRAVVMGRVHAPKVLWLGQGGLRARRWPTSLWTRRSTACCARAM